MGHRDQGPDREQEGLQNDSAEIMALQVQKGGESGEGTRVMRGCSYFSVKVWGTEQGLSLHWMWLGVGMRNGGLWISSQR